MITLDVNKVDSFVERQQALGNNVRWDGWTMVFFKPSAGAVYSPRGRRVGDEWGFEFRVRPNSKGYWKVKHEHVVRSPRN